MDESKAERLERAARELEEMQARIAPFIKRRERGGRTKATRWQNTGNVVARRPKSSRRACA